MPERSMPLSPLSEVSGVVCAKHASSAGHSSPRRISNHLLPEESIDNGANAKPNGTSHLDAAPKETPIQTRSKDPSSSSTHPSPVKPYSELSQSQNASRTDAYCSDEQTIPCVCKRYGCTKVYKGRNAKSSLMRHYNAVLSATSIDSRQSDHIRKSHPLEVVTKAKLGEPIELGESQNRMTVGLPLSP
jgi:hypothetical protein